MDDKQSPRKNRKERESTAFDSKIVVRQTQRNYLEHAPLLNPLEYKSLSAQEAPLVEKLQTRHDQLVTALIEGVCGLDEKWKITYLNLEAQRVFGVIGETLIGKSIFDFVRFSAGNENKKVLDAEFFQSFAEQNKIFHNDPVYISRRNNRTIPVIFVFKPIVEKGDVKGAVIAVHDLSLLKSLENRLMTRTLRDREIEAHNREELKRSAQALENANNELALLDTRDSLTGLWNRQYFQSQIENILESAKAFSIEHAFLYMDVDQFKVVNDNCGQVAGDELLKQVANLLKSRVRRFDVVARLGDDEFGLVLLYCNPSHAVKVADELREKIKNQAFHWNGISFRVSISIGVVGFNGNKETVVSLFSKADTACTLAKEAGRDRTYLYRDDDDHFVNRIGEIACVAQIHRALEHDDLVVYCQKIVSTHNREHVEQCEILVRMYDADRNLLPPGAFLPAAERFNVITDIDRAVFTKTCALLCQYRDRLTHLSRMAVNLSAQSIIEPTFINFITSTLAKYDLPVEKFCFEVTETSAIANLTQAVSFINRLHEMGAHFSLDDFGTGLSSFGYLKNLPVDYLKIDGFFVKDIVADPINEAFVASINDIGHVLGKKTIAEFVEDDRCFQRLQHLGVDFVQGYGISTPRPLEEYLQECGNPPTKRA